MKRHLRFEGADGLELAADAWGPPEGIPVLLLHGGGQTRHAWSGTAQALARHGFYAVSMDLRGHGDSEWSPDRDYRHRSFAADTALVARQLPQPPVLVGASLGGLSALFALGEAARRNDSRPLARALVLVDIATRMERDGARRIMEFMGSGADGFASLEEAADAIARYNPHRPRPRDPSGLRKNLRRHADGRYRWHWDPAFIEGRQGAHTLEDRALLDAAAHGLRLPTLLVRGRMSDLLSEEGAREFLCQVPHARFVDVSGAGHMVAGDRNDAFTQAVLDFLTEVVLREAEEPR